MKPALTRALIASLLAATVTVALAPGVTASAAAATPTAVVAAGGPLNLRSGPSTADTRVGSVPDGARVTAVCQEFGERVKGTPYWDRLSNGRYVADGYLRWSPARPWLPWCTAKGASVAKISTGGGPANVRAGTSTSAKRLGTLKNGAVVSINCQVWGQKVDEHVRTTNAWNRLTDGRYVSDALVAYSKGMPALPWCGQVPPTVPASGAAQFLARVAEPAQLGFKKYKVPASVTIAQAILESGWGRSYLTRRDHSYFGIKCFGNPGTIALGCRSYATRECENGRCFDTRATFRAYKNATASFADHGYFLTVHDRYDTAFKYSNDPNRFAKEIHKAGYATDPNYANDLIKLMKDYNLYRYDPPARAKKAKP
ncbi:sporangiospore maturation cell wall hydrolase GsmA [Asanoa sp. WMMD1127]|uniref:sporangiospore maturation cell wall hydrolase GsmA n=1 Tax=Asanoa sp. WMMD1127 TaxID=3016107 RepID=UPI0024172186|nr:sporangiospore maturation cell wall hydrolase GsmA [Asanoa sp. WMMD1127]MDG4826905.1 sporangiospore maturation cell wall hydrolase GsmA [Asanoa sp. WMMD1127]